MKQKYIWCKTVAKKEVIKNGILASLSHTRQLVDVAAATQEFKQNCVRAKADLFSILTIKSKPLKTSLCFIHRY